MGTRGERLFEELKGSVNSREANRKTDENLSDIYQRQNLGLRVLAVSAATALDNKASIVTVTGNAVGFNVTLAKANSWKGRSPPLFIVRLDAAAGVHRIIPAAGETVNGGVGVTMAANTGYLLVCDGVSAWYTIP